MIAQSFLKICLLCVNFEKFGYHAKPTKELCALLDGRFIEVNFSKLRHKQIFRNDFDCNHYHIFNFQLKLLSVKILPRRISYSYSIPINLLCYDYGTSLYLLMNQCCLDVQVYQCRSVSTFSPRIQNVHLWLHSQKKTIQYGYRKCGTHAGVFSQTLAQGNIKNEIR